jgi:hypothetical protein
MGRGSVSECAGGQTRRRKDEKWFSNEQHVGAAFRRLHATKHARARAQRRRGRQQRAGFGGWGQFMRRAAASSV